MSENECRGEPYVRPRTKIGIEPMPEGERFIFILDHRFDTGFCSRENTRFAPTFDLDHRFDSGFCFPHPLDTPNLNQLKMKGVIIMNHIKYRLILLLIISLANIYQVSADPLSTNSYIIPRDVFSQAGILENSTSYKVLSTMGQASPVGRIESNTYILSSGFQYRLNNEIPWRMNIFSQGTPLVRTSNYMITIGVENASELLEAPPETPEYSTKMDIYSFDFTKCYSKDIRASGADSYSWVIGINPQGNVSGPEGSISVVSWDPQQLHPNADDWFYRIRTGYASDGGIIVQDMRQESQLSVTGNNAVQFFTIECSKRSEIEIKLHLQAGWNLISLPLIPTDAKLSTLFPGAEIAYEFQRVYLNAEKLEPHKGYWIKTPEERSYLIKGELIRSYSVNLSKGWHLLGSISCKTKPEVSVDGALTSIYTYSNRYELSEEIPPGKGVRVKIKEDCVFQMECLAIGSPIKGLVKKKNTSPLTKIGHF